MDTFFKELGSKMLEQWKRENFSLGKFPEIARRALEARRPSEHVDLSAFIQEFLLNDEQPLQTQSGFGFTSRFCFGWMGRQIFISMSSRGLFM
jgi:hypothetical protein